MKAMKPLFHGFHYQNFLSIYQHFFQAEDGIRDRSPSRGLGDVYKRQVQKYENIVDLDNPEKMSIWLLS